MSANSTIASETAECPLCGEECSDRSDLRVHLNVDHRKSEVADTLISAFEERGRPIGTEP
jgi:hypothetical protein